MPKTAVGKIFKPDLRRLAIARVLDETLAEAKLAARVREVVEDKKRGLVARSERQGEVDESAVARKLGEFAQAWDWAPEK